MAPAAARPLVMKFGGTSVGSPAAMRHAVDIVRREADRWPGVVVVTSALAGTTDTLLRAAKAAAQGDLDAVRRARQALEEAHWAIAKSLVPTRPRPMVWMEVQRHLETFESLGQAMAVLGEATPRGLDAVAALGERMSVALLTAALQAQGVPAEALDAAEVLVTDAHFGAAHPDLEASRQRVQARLVPRLEPGRVVVVPGFLAATPEGVVTTLGRGGSDYSAALLAALLPAAEVWIWTDVDGVMSADPRLVPNAHTIPELSYREVAELAYFGAKVLHPKTIRPVIEAGIPLRVRNTFHPQGPSTLIVRERQVTPGQIKAITLIRDLSLIIVEGRGMLGVPGVAARTFAAVAGTGTSVLLISQASSEQSICFIVPGARQRTVVQAVEAAFAAEIARRDIDRVRAMEDVVIVTLVGEGMRHTPGIAGRIFSALGARGINVIAIAQGASEVAISLVVAAEDGQRALQALHPLTVDG